MVKPAPSYSQATLLVVISFVIASVINIYPMSLTTAHFRPMALIMVLIFWVIHRPRYVGVGVAFFIGLIADLLMDTQLGQQALSAVITAFVIRLIGQYVRQLSLPLAWIIAVVGLVTFQFSLWIIQLLTNDVFVIESGFALVVSIITWPIVYILLVRLQK